jgi:hypothetical protein
LEISIFTRRSKRRSLLSNGAGLKRNAAEGLFTRPSVLFHFTTDITKIQLAAGSPVGKKVPSGEAFEYLESSGEGHFMDWIRQDSDTMIQVPGLRSGAAPGSGIVLLPYIEPLGKHRGMLRLKVKGGIKEYSGC